MVHLPCTLEMISMYGSKKLGYRAVSCDRECQERNIQKSIESARRQRRGGRDREIKRRQREGGREIWGREREEKMWELISERALMRVK